MEGRCRALPRLDVMGLELVVEGGVAPSQATVPRARAAMVPASRTPTHTMVPVHLPDQLAVPAHLRQVVVTLHAHPHLSRRGSAMLMLPVQLQGIPVLGTAVGWEVGVVVTGAPGLALLQEEGVELGMGCLGVEVALDQHHPVILQADLPTGMSLLQGLVVGEEVAVVDPGKMTTPPLETTGAREEEQVLTVDQGASRLGVVVGDLALGEEGDTLMGAKTTRRYM